MAASYSNTKPAVPIVSKIAGLVGSPTANYGIQSPAPKPQTLPGLGSQPGMIAPQFTQPATPVKSTSITQPNGTVITQTHHTETTPTTNKSTSTNSPAVTPPAYDHTTGFLTDYGRSQGLKEVNGQTGSNPGMINQNTPAPGPTKNPPPGNTVGSQLGNVSDTGGQTQNEYNTQQQVINQSKNQGQAYTDAMNVYNKDVEDLRKLREAEAGSMAGEANRAIPLNFVQGRQQVLQSQYGQREAALGSEIGAAANVLSAANQNQGLQNSQASTAYSGAQSQAGRNAGVQQGILGAVTPTFQNYTNAQYNPATNTYGSVGGGQYGSGPAAASNVSSIGDAQSKINNIDQNSDAINNNFSRAINYANSAGLTGSSPILSGFQRLYGQNFQTNPAVVGFTQAVGALNTQLQSLGETPIDLNNATQQTLTQAQETVKKDLLTQRTNAQDFISKFNNGGDSNSNSGSYTSSSGNTYKLPY